MINTCAVVYTRAADTNTHTCARKAGYRKLANMQGTPRYYLHYLNNACGGFSTNIWLCTGHMCISVQAMYWSYVHKCTQVQALQCVITLAMFL